ncbi:efflux RND transporter periplasmic adaptor subunit [Aureimonas leprariae]|uniref:HlyD family secretion protein n=1 Tax=Plantimonas leprariae TaxID=2615207 RepID=A0A7V7TVK9_9HYPH|nr:HlyD family secretion protein [Aureimonas leprariae]KAB0677749.1 HlyD family secretion protein [Aureimonas leprariae]
MIVVRLALTALFVIGAVFGVTFIWTTYFEAPWTRDARVFARTVQVASYVAGNVVELPVRNNSPVKKGDLLMRIDPATYQSAVRQAQAQLDVAIANRNIQADNTNRTTQLSRGDANTVSQATVVQAQLQLASSNANVEASQASLEDAQINLARTEIRANVDGFVTNLRVDVGDYAQPGSAVMAIVDAASYRVDAYFMETKLPRIEVGATARLRMMASGKVLQGRVRSIARAIADSQNATASDLLLAPEPAFEWIRLAQRVPVDIGFENVPADFPLVSGATVTVIVDQPPGERNLAWYERAWGPLRAAFAAD